MMRIEFNNLRMSMREQMYLTFLEGIHDEKLLSAKREDIANNMTKYWPRYRDIELAKRKKEEAMLVSKGYKIDDSYQDPDLLPYLQKEPKF